MNEQALTLSQRAKEIDRISSAAMEAFASAESFEQELTVAQAMVDLRANLTAEVMQPIMALMDTPTGFKTDRNPIGKDGKPALDRDLKPITPYPMEAVREVFIESRMRGFHAIGNEFNIIAGNFYACRAGLERKVRHHPNISDFDDGYGTASMVNEKYARVVCRAKWKQDGVAQSIEQPFDIRVNNGMGADAVMGKAARKLFAAVYKRLTGKVTPEGEAGDEPLVTDVKSTVTPAPSASEVFRGKAAEKNLKESEAPNGANATAQTRASAEAATQTPTQPTQTQTPHTPPGASLSGDALTPQAEIGEIVTKNGFTFADLMKWGRSENRFTAQEEATCKTFADLPTGITRMLVKNKAGMLRGCAVAKSAR